MAKRNSTVEFKAHNLDFLQNYLSMKQVDQALVRTIITAMEPLVSKLNQHATSRSDYLLRVFDEIRSLDDTVNNLTEHINNTLIYLNFNSRQYFLYQVTTISERLKSEESISGRLEMLAYEAKRVNQILSEASIQYTDKYPPLKEMIISWITEETVYLERRRELSSVRLISDIPTKRAIKLSLDMSVAQFTCLIRGLIERKYILNSNLSELANLLSGVVITKRSENISEGSFRRKYYNIEDSTKKSVIEMLNKTIDWLMKS